MGQKPEHNEVVAALVSVLIAALTAIKDKVDEENAFEPTVRNAVTNYGKPCEGGDGSPVDWRTDWWYKSMFVARLP